MKNLRTELVPGSNAWAIERAARLLLHRSKFHETLYTTRAVHIFSPVPLQGGSLIAGGLRPIRLSQEEVCGFWWGRPIERAAFGVSYDPYTQMKHTDALEQLAHVYLWCHYHRVVEASLVLPMLADEVDETRREQWRNATKGECRGDADFYSRIQQYLAVQLDIGFDPDPPVQGRLHSFSVEELLRDPEEGA